MWPFSIRRGRSIDRWDLSAEVLQLCTGCSVSLSQACQGTQIFGSSGSGKSSGSVATIARAYLRQGWGGLFCTAKREDRETYERWAREEGRADDVLVFSPDHALRYNFINAELTDRENPVGLVEGLTALLMTVTELLQGSQSGSGRDNDGYFKTMAERLARNAILVQYLAYSRVTIPDLLRFLASCSRNLEEAKSASWQAESFCFLSLTLADKAPKSESLKADLDLAISFFLREWVEMSSRTRASVETTLTAALDLLGRGAARDLLSAPTTNVSPQMCHEGAIVIADFPTLLYSDIGRLIQVVLKFSWQRAHNRRDVGRNPRPTFIIADESHLLAVSSDQTFQTTARSSRTAVVYATQSISNYLEVFGDRSEPRVHSLLGNLQTQIFHQQTDIRTIEYVQQLVGRSRQFSMSGNTSGDGDWLSPLLGMGGRTSSCGFQEQWEFELQAGDLNSLAKGGPPDWIVEAILYQGGARFPNGRTWMPVAFRQDVGARSKR
jgi:hypothetical protein